MVHKDSVNDAVQRSQVQTRADLAVVPPLLHERVLHVVDVTPTRHVLASISTTYYIYLAKCTYLCTSR